MLGLGWNAPMGMRTGPMCIFPRGKSTVTIRTTKRFHTLAITTTARRIRAKRLVRTKRLVLTKRWLTVLRQLTVLHRWRPWRRTMTMRSMLPA